MASITIDGLDEEVFRRNIEAMLRVGEADRAALKLRALIEPFAGEGQMLPARFLQVTAADFRLEGWEHLGECLARNDSPRNPISALTIAVSDAEAMGISEAEAGEAVPLIATSHFTDEAYMFSQCAISDLLDGYSFYGCEWHGSSKHMDTALSLAGVDDLYRAVAAIEAELIDSERPALDMIRAGSLASCYLAVLLFQAVRDTIRARGLPRPLCVTAGNEGVYPYFDAPVIGSAECVEQGLVNGAAAAPAKTARKGAAPVPETAELAEAGFAYGRLGELAGRKGEKKMVLELAEADVRTAAEMFDRAGEERMADDGAAPEDLLAHRGPSHPLFALNRSEPAPGAPPSEHGTADEPAPAPLPAGVDPFASAGSFPELVEAGGWSAGQGKSQPQPADPGDIAARRDAASTAEQPMDQAAPEWPEPEPRELQKPETQAPEPQPEPPVRVASSHSLRARFADSPPPPPPSPGLVAALLRWLRNIFG